MVKAFVLPGSINGNTFSIAGQNSDYTIISISYVATFQIAVPSYVQLYGPNVPEDVLSLTLGSDPYGLLRMPGVSYGTLNLINGEINFTALQSFSYSKRLLHPIVVPSGFSLTLTSDAGGALRGLFSNLTQSLPALSHVRVMVVS